MKQSGKSPDVKNAKTYAFQGQIPRLPVPKLRETCDKYLKSLEPLEELAGHVQITRSIVEEFLQPRGDGERLQAKLEARAKEKDNWLDEWWYKYAYLTWRGSLPVGVSIYMLFDDELVKEGVPQAFQAARLIHGFMKYKMILDNEGIPPEMMRDKPLCMAQYKKMFTSARIPVKGEDVIRYTSPSSEKVLVISNKQFYIFKTTSQNGNLLPVEALLLQMNRILEDSKHSAPKRTVGAFTADDRDRWAKNRELLSSLSPLNKRYLNDIEECAFVVCLENTTPHSIEEVAQYTFKSDANNRWYDKVLQFIVFANGRASFIGEHSPLDASPISEMMDQVLTSLQPASPSELRTADVTLPNEPEKFQWVLSQEILEDMEKSEAGYNAACSNIDFAILHYKGYGSDWIKNMKLPPDAYIQMALQLTYYRLNGKPCPTYETAMTRQFLYGRTETCRSCSVDSVAWTKAMMSKDVSTNEKIALLKKAMDSHRKYMLDAVNGRGCDRHLLGLKILAAEEGKQPAIFTDKAYSASNTWRLSTSSIPCRTYTPGFAAVVEDGYGICYNPRKKEIRMSILSYHSCPSTSSWKFKHAMQQSLDEMRALFESQTSKL